MAKIPKVVRCGGVLCWAGSNPLLHRIRCGFPRRAAWRSARNAEPRITRSDERKNSTPRGANREKKAFQNRNSAEGNTRAAGCGGQQTPPGKKQAHSFFF